MVHNIVVLLLCTGLVAVAAAIHQEDVSMNGDIALRLNGSSHCYNATGKAVSLSLESCSQQNCELKKDKSYKGSVSFVPSVTSYNATVTISAAVNTSIPTILEPSTCNITANRNVTCAFKLKFPKSWKTNGKHSVDVDVMVGKAYQVCQRFPIMLKASADKIGLSFLLLGALQLILHIKSSA